MGLTLKYNDVHRHATWLELFFDLVFVAVIGVITHDLAHTHDNHISMEQVGLFLLQFVPVWWIWASHTMYCNRFDTDSKAHRIATLVMMLLLITLPTFFSKNVEEHFANFAIAYMLIRLITAGLYLASTSKHEGKGIYAKDMGIGFVIAALICGSSVFFEESTMYYVFFAGLAFDMLWPIFLRKKVRSIHIDLPHLVERTGLLSIILLGESVISLVGSLSGGIEWNAQSIMAALTGFIMLGAIWWIYFDSFNNLEKAKLIVTGLPIIYSHLLLCMGLVILANVIGHTIKSDLDNPYYSLLAIAGMTLFYIGKQIPYYIAFPNMRINLIINSIVCIGITGLATLLPTREYTLIGMTIGMLFYVFSNIKWTLSKDSSEYLKSEH